MNENWTGERLETFIYNENTIEHLHRYAIAVQYAKGKVVLDIACGEGYGSNLLAKVGEKVTGVDIDENTITKARKKYTRQNLEFKTGSTSSIPLPDSYCDLVISFETIEHHNEHEQMMLEIKRVLKQGGMLIISSPDKKYYSDIPAYKNPFHVKELYFDEFKSLISKYFLNAQYYFQNNITGSLIMPEIRYSPETKFYSGNYDLIEEEALQPLYNICIASDKSLEPAGICFFNDKYIREFLLEQQRIAIENSYNKRLNDMKDLYSKSWSFRIGRLITSPLRLFRK